MARWEYRKGLADLGNGCHAWLLPDGSRGYSNAGLVTDSGQALRVDTLFDPELARRQRTQWALPQGAGPEGRMDFVPHEP